MRGVKDQTKFKRFKTKPSNRDIGFSAVNFVRPSEKSYRSEEGHRLAHFVPEEKLVPADEDLSEPLEDLGAVDLLVADEPRADEVKNLGANIRTNKGSEDQNQEAGCGFGQGGQHSCGPTGTRWWNILGFPYEPRRIFNYFHCCHEELGVKKTKNNHCKWSWYYSVYCSENQK